MGLRHTRPPVIPAREPSDSVIRRLIEPYQVLQHQGAVDTLPAEDDQASALIDPAEPNGGEAEVGDELGNAQLGLCIIARHEHHAAAAVLGRIRGQQLRGKLIEGLDDPRTDEGFRHDVGRGPTSELLRRDAVGVHRIDDDPAVPVGTGAGDRRVRAKRNRQDDDVGHERFLERKRPHPGAEPPDDRLGGVSPARVRDADLDPASGEELGQCKADLAGADDGNVHVDSFEKTGCGHSNGTRRSSGLSGGDCRDVVQRPCDGGRLGFRAERDTFGAHDLDVAHAEKSEQPDQVAFLMFVCRSRAARGVDAAACRGDERLLAVKQTACSGRGVLKGLAGDGNPVDPGLERRRNREVVHRRPDDQEVRAQQFVEVGVALGHIRNDADIGRDDATTRGQVSAFEMQRRIGCQVAIRHMNVRVHGPEPRHQFGGKTAADRSGTEQAGIEMEELHGVKFERKLRRGDDGLGISEDSRTVIPGWPNDRCPTTRCGSRYIAIRSIFPGDGRPHMLDGVSLDQLRTFVAAVDEGSFSAAARKLRRVQSAVSGWIGGLEDQLGVVLFDRAGRYPRLTSEGALLLADARDIVSGVDALKARAHSMTSGVEAELAVVIDVFFPTAAVSNVAKAFASRFPLTPLRVFVEGLGAAYQPVLDGRCSLGILGPLAQVFPSLVSEPLGELPLVTVTAASHPLASVGRRISKRALAKHVQLVLTDRTEITAGQDYGVASPSTWRLADLSTKHAFLTDGVGWGNMPLHMVESDIAAGRLVVLSVDGMPSTGFMLAMSAFHRSSQPPGPAGRWFVEQLKAACQLEPADRGGRPDRKRAPVGR